MKEQERIKREMNSCSSIRYQSGKRKVIDSILRRMFLHSYFLVSCSKYMPAVMIIFFFYFFLQVSSESDT